MTNIAAAKLLEGSSKNPEETLMFIADSMGSITEKREKTDNFQKLFKLQDYLLSFTTQNSSEGLKIIELLNNKQYSTTENMAEKILKISKDVLKRNKNSTPLNFIIGGKNGDNLDIRQIVTTRNIHASAQFTHDGSASRFIETYWRGMDASGKGILADNKVELIALLQEFGKQGSIDAGVNDKLQYGFITKNGVSRLFHPEVAFMSEQIYIEYLTEMIGKPIKNYNENKNIEDYIKNEKIRVYSNSLLGEVFHALEKEVTFYRELNQRFTRDTENWKKHKLPTSELERRREQIEEQHKKIYQGLSAIIKRGFSPIKKYKNGFNRRQNKQDKFLKENL